MYNNGVPQNGVPQNGHSNGAMVANSSQSTSTQQPSAAAFKQQILKQQRLLLFLRHCAKCKDAHCPHAMSCETGKALWHHLVRCKSDECKWPRCVHARELLRHYQKCKNAECSICGPVRKYVESAKGQNDRGALNGHDSGALMLQPHPSMQMYPGAGGMLAGQQGMPPGGSMLMPENGMHLPPGAMHGGMQPPLDGYALQNGARGIKHERDMYGMQPPPAQPQHPGMLPGYEHDTKRAKQMTMGHDEAPKSMDEIKARHMRLRLLACVAFLAHGARLVRLVVTRGNV